MFRLIGGIIDRVFSLTGAVIFSQAPSFLQQYQQQLTGRIEELKWQVKVMEESASLTGKNLQEYINKFLINDDLDFRHQGEMMKNSLDRLNSYLNQLNGLELSTPFGKPFIFVQNHDWNIIKSTWANFQFNVPITVEAALYGLFGMVIFYSIFSLFKSIVKPVFT